MTSIRLRLTSTASTATFLAGLVVLAVFFLSAAVFAQPVDSSTAELPRLEEILQSIHSGNGWAIAGGLVTLLTWALRKGVLNRLPWPAAVVWLHDHPVIGLATPFVLSALGGIVTTFAAGTPFTWSALLMDVVKVSGAAVLGFVGANKIEESKGFGAAAAAAITEKKAAIAELKGPTP